MYIFLMDQGQLEQLTPTPPSVSRLQGEVEEKFGLNVDNQILLVSGGFRLGPDDRLPYNGAGLNESNPIYVFTRTTDASESRQPDIWSVCDGGLASELKQCLTLPISYGMLNQSACCVDKIVQVAKETRKAIQALLSQQGQMIQGWHAALANLAEFATETEKRVSVCRKEIAPFETCQTEWANKFQRVSELKRDLSQIPLLPQLSQQFSGLLDFSDVSSAPSNLYEWFCLQCTLSCGGITPLSGRKSSMAKPNAARLQIAARFLRRPDLLSSGRLRTTSAEQLGQELPLPVPNMNIQQRSSPLAVGNSTPTVPPHPNPSGAVHTTVGTVGGGGLLGTSNPRNPFYSSGSQPSLSSLQNYCWAEESSSPSVSSTIGDGISGAAASELESFAVGWDPYEFDFLSVIHKAQQQLNYLRYGSQSVPDTAAESSGELTYVQLLLIQMEELLLLLSTCSGRENSHDICDLSPDRGNDHDESVVTRQSPEFMSECSIAGECTAVGAIRTFSHIHPDLVNQTREALSLRYFSEHLACVSELNNEAGRTNEDIHQVQNILNELRRHGRQLSGCVTHFETVLRSFGHLCGLLDETMNYKLELSTALKQRQRWLGNFQSEMERLASAIQRCALQSKRVTTTATLLSQLQKAPEVYIRCLVEVARQYDFDQAMGQMSREQKTIKSGETQRRRIFAKQIKENILQFLFSPWIRSKCERREQHTRPANSPDFEIISDESVNNRTVTGSVVSNYSRQSSRNLETVSAAPRSSLTSHSEPQLNKLCKTPSATTRLPVRLRPKDIGFLSTSPVLQEVHEDEVDGRTTEMPMPTRNTSGSNLAVQSRCSNRFSATTSASFSKADRLRRASIPVEIDGVYTTPKWSIEDTDAFTETADAFLNADPLAPSSASYITIDDLTKLSLLLPPSLADYLREELTKICTRRVIFPPSNSGPLQAARYAAEHLGLRPQSRSTSGDRSPQFDHAQGDSVPVVSVTKSTVATSPCLSSSDVVSVDAACQVDSLLMCHSPVTQWPLRSHSASLFLPAGDSSPPQIAHTWEPIPSSLCSWDLCHILPNRSLRRSVSMNAVAKFQSVISRATQTGEDESDAEQVGPISDTHVHSPDIGSMNAVSHGDPRQRLSQSSLPHSDALSLVSSAASDTQPSLATVKATVAHSEKGNDEDNHIKDANDTQRIDSVPNDSSYISATYTFDREGVSTSGRHDRHDHLPISALDLDDTFGMLNSTGFPSTEHSNGADAEFATPSTMMSSSFHSTRTNFSHRSDSAAHWLRTPCAGEMERSGDRSDELGATPTINKDQWLEQHQVRGHSCSADRHSIHEPHFISREPSPQDPDCSCLLDNLHLRCLRLLEQYAGTILLKHNRHNHHQQQRETNDEHDTAERDWENGATELLASDDSSSCAATRLDHLVKVLLSLAVDHPQRPCPVHPDRDRNREQGRQCSGALAQLLRTHLDHVRDSQLCNTQTSFPALVKSDTHRRVGTSSGTVETVTLGVQTESEAVAVREVSDTGTTTTAFAESCADELSATTESAEPTGPIEPRKTTAVCIDASSAGRGHASLLPVPLRSSSDKQTPSVLPDPVGLGCVTILDRSLTIAHANFVMNDTVMFVPVRGATRHARSSHTGVDGSMRVTTGAFVNPSDTEPQNQQPAVSFSMLSSTIIQSMDTWSTLQNSSRNTPTSGTKSKGRGRDLMYSSLVHSVTPSTSALARNLLLDNGVDGATGASGGQSRRHGSSARSKSGASGSLPPVTQWRMLSTDGQVYFLHQDDFSALNLDMQTDYCQPVQSTGPDGPRHQHHRGNRHVRNTSGSITNEASEEPSPPVSSLSTSSGGCDDGAPTNSKPHSYFVLALYQRKERCLSKRADNRFNLPVDFTFYRVRAKPLPMPAELCYALPTSP